MGATERGGTDSYCPSCGSEVADGDGYCSSCGHDLSRPAGSSERSLREFRARVGDHVADGWTIEYDAGDEVALVDRRYGSVLVHVLLFFPTSGLGNLLYGWYHYEHNAERKVIRAGGSDTRPSRGESELRGDGADERSLSSYVRGLVLVVLAAVALSSLGLSAVGLTAALALLVLATLVLPPTRRRIENRRPPTTFGPTTSVDERFVADTNKPCSVCFDRVDHGVKREYDRSYVVAGLPLFTIERGENWYCESCREEITDVDAVPADSREAELAGGDVADRGDSDPAEARSNREGHAGSNRQDATDGEALLDEES